MKKPLTRLEGHQAMSNPGKRCYEIIELASEHRLPVDDKGTSPDELHQRVSAFLADYKSWSEARDADVAAYLGRTPRQYRVFLPNRKTSPKVASEVSWYFDEVVLSDPIRNCLLDTPFSVFQGNGIRLVSTQMGRAASLAVRDKVSAYVNDWLAKFAVLEKPLKDGVVLMSSMFLGTDLSGLHANSKVGEILSMSGVRQALMDGYSLSSRIEVQPGAIGQMANQGEVYKYEAFVYRRVRGHDSREVLTGDWDIRLPAGAEMSLTLPSLEDDYFHPICPGRVPDGFAEAVDVMLRRDVLDLVSLAAWATTSRGSVLGTDVTMGNIVKQAIAGGESARELERRIVWSHQVTLPHVYSVDPVMLYRMRADLPSSFEVFRKQMTSYCLDSSSEEQARSKAEDIVRLAVELEASLRGSSVFNRIIGYGSSIGGVLGAGMLSVDWVTGAPGLAGLLATIFREGERLLRQPGAKRNAQTPRRIQAISCGRLGSMRGSDWRTQDVLRPGRAKSSAAGMTSNTIYRQDVSKTRRQLSLRHHHSAPAGSAVPPVECPATAARSSTTPPCSATTPAPAAAAQARAAEHPARHRAASSGWLARRHADGGLRG